MTVLIPSYPFPTPSPLFEKDLLRMNCQALLMYRCDVTAGALLLLMAAGIARASPVSEISVIDYSPSKAIHKYHYSVVQGEINSLQPAAMKGKVTEGYATEFSEEPTAKFTANGKVGNQGNGTTTERNPPPEEKDQLTTWSIAWYLTLLAAFIIFFILVGLMEIFCRKSARNGSWGRRGRGEARQNSQQPSPEELEPPPPYDLFKPPSYNTLFPPEGMVQEDKAHLDTPQHPPEQLVYVVSVHGGRGVS